MKERAETVANEEDCLIIGKVFRKKEEDELMTS